MRSDSIRTGASDNDIRLAVFQAIGRIHDGESAPSVADDLGIPTNTVLRWSAKFTQSGIAGIAALRPPITLPAAFDAEDMAQRAFDAPPGLEKTIFSALAAAYHGSSNSELAAYYGVSKSEIQSWVKMLASRGPLAITRIFRRGNWDRIAPGQAIVGRRPLPIGYTAKLLRRFASHSSSAAGSRITMIAMIYEGRTPTQVSDHFGIHLAMVEHWIRTFIQKGIYGLAAPSRMYRVPDRPGFSASKIRALADNAPIPAYRTRLEIIADAYSGKPWRDIADERGIPHSTVAAFVRYFEDEGPTGLATGEATLTPPLRIDYNANKLWKIVAKTQDPVPARKLEVIARLYDGHTMHEVSVGASAAITVVSIWVDAFNRLGHTFADGFNASLHAPAPPPERKVAPPLRSDIDAPTIASYLEQAQHPSRRRIEAVLDIASGMTATQAAEKHKTDFKAIRGWINGFNENGRAWLASGLTTRHLTERCRTLIELGIKPEGVANLVGADIEFVRSLHGQVMEAKNPKAEIHLPADLKTAELKLAARSRAEPFRTYASIISAIYDGRQPGRVMSRFGIDRSELLSIVNAFRHSQMAGLAADPLGGAISLERGFWTPARKQKPYRIPRGERLRSCLRVASGGRSKVLKAVSLAADGLPLTSIMAKTSASARQVRAWVEEYNERTLWNSIDLERNPVRITNTSYETSTLKSLSGSVHDPVFSRNIRIITEVASDLQRASICDRLGVTYDYVKACVRAYNSNGLGGLANMPSSFREATLVPGNEGPPEHFIVLIDDRILTRAPPSPKKLDVQRGYPQLGEMAPAPDLKALDTLEDTAHVPTSLPAAQQATSSPAKPPAPPEPGTWVRLPNASSGSSADILREVVGRLFNEGHRKELEAVCILYEYRGMLKPAARVSGLSVEELTDIGERYTQHGFLLGRYKNTDILPGVHDKEGLARAATEGPFRKLAQIVVRLYDGDSLSDIREDFELQEDDIRRIASAYRRHGVDGLSAVVLASPKPPKPTEAEAAEIRQARADERRQAALAARDAKRAQAAETRRIAKEAEIAARADKAAARKAEAAARMARAAQEKEEAKAAKAATREAEQAAFAAKLAMERRAVREARAASRETEKAVRIAREAREKEEAKAAKAAAREASKAALLASAAMKRKAIKEANDAAMSAASKAAKTVKVTRPRGRPRREATPSPPVAKTVRKQEASIFTKAGGDRRIDAVTEFRHTRDIKAVSEKYNVSQATLEKWIVAFVRSGQTAP